MAGIKMDCNNSTRSFLIARIYFSLVLVLSVLSISVNATTTSTLIAPSDSNIGIEQEVITVAEDGHVGDVSTTTTDPGPEAVPSEALSGENNGGVTSTVTQAPNENTNSSWLLVVIVLIVGLGLAMFFWFRADKLQLEAKMISLVATLLTLVFIIVAVGVLSMNKTGQELTKIAVVDIPLADTLAKIRTDQFEQSIWLERAISAAESNSTESHSVDQVSNEFERLTGNINDKFKTAEELTAQARILVTNWQAQTKYLQFIEQLAQIKEKYQDFSEHGEEILTVLGQGQNIGVLDLLNSIEVENGQLSQELLVLEQEVSEFTEQSALMAEHHGQSSMQTMGIVSALGIMLAIFIWMIILRTITKPLDSVATVMKQIAEGDLTTANGQTVIGKNELPDAIGQVRHSSRIMRTRLVEVISGIRISATEMATVTEQVSQGNMDLNQRTQEQASSLEEVASSMEQMTSTVNQNAENAKRANQLVTAACNQAEKGGEVVNQAINAMNEINRSSKQISDIVGLIDEIAFQTNLLALNAAVEAARAGEQGRGFAVVANEVRNLAGRCTTAAKEIKELIENSMSKIKSGTKLVDESGQALEDIMLSVRKVSDVVAEIAMASQEQSNGINQVNKALMRMDEMTQQNAYLVEEAATASKAMGEQAQDLNVLVAFFKLDEHMSTALNQIQDIKESNGKDNSGEQEISEIYLELSEAPIPQKLLSANEVSNLN